MSGRKVNTKSPQPNYYQLVNIIQDQIASGELRPGDRLPTEAQLCEFHGISPMTVHRAITELKNNNVIIAERGKGIFVKSVQFWDASFKLGDFQYLFSEDSDASVKILGLKILLADSLTADKLNIKTGKKVIFIQRMISSQDKPFVYHEEYLLYDPEKPIIESQMEITSLKGLFDGKNNQYLKKTSLSIHSVNLKQEEAKLLNAPLNAAAFRLEHVFYDYNDNPVSWGWFLCPGDRIHFSTVTGIRNGE